VRTLVETGILVGEPGAYGLAKPLDQASQAQGDYRRAIDCFRETVASFEGARRHERFGQAYLPAVISRALLAACHAELGVFAEGRTLGAEGLQKAETVGHPGSLMIAYFGSGLLALPLADELGMRPLQAHCHHGLGTLYIKTGQREQARPELDAAIDLYRAMEMTFWLPQAEAALVQAEGW
jgi:tetratricopeptide (TPR) repeat protein